MVGTQCARNRRREPRRRRRASTFRDAERDDDQGPTTYADRRFRHCCCRLILLTAFILLFFVFCQTVFINVFRAYSLCARSFIMSGNICQYFNCYKSKRNFPKLKMFRFPRDEKRLNTWIVNTGWKYVKFSFYHCSIISQEYSNDDKSKFSIRYTFLAKNKYLTYLSIVLNLWIRREAHKETNCFKT